MNRNSIIFAILCLLLTFCAAEAPARIGSDTCLGCHEDIQARIQKTAHFKPNPVECEDCHGPGGAHGDEPAATNIVTLKGTPAQKIMETCTRCHREYRSNYSSHTTTGRACLNCHDMWHSEKTVKSQLIPSDHLVTTKNWDQCLTCHRRQQAEFARPYHHQAGRFNNQCVACHDPHVTRKELRSKAIDEKCARCHPDFGGPFVYVHLGTQDKGCIGCHFPHGGTNPNLLNRNTTRFLCLSCHPDTPRLHNQANALYQQCTACHTAIHGSNFDPKFFQ